jgi:hypothetical protein
MSWPRFEPCIIRTQVPPKPTVSVGMPLECGSLKGVATAEHVTAIFIDVCFHKATMEPDPCVSCNCVSQKQKTGEWRPLCLEQKLEYKCSSTAMLTFFSLHWSVRIRICYVDRYNCLVEGTEQMSYYFITY